MLPFREIIAVDFEFHSGDGDHPKVWCMAARELRTGKTWQLFADELEHYPQPPFAVGDDSVVVAYFASAEVNCFLSLGWQTPRHVLDLYTEFRVLSNGLSLVHGRGLLGALAWHGLESIESDEKRAMQALAIRGAPFTQEERTALLNYCLSDVIALERLLPLMLPTLDLPRALVRGNYMRTVAQMEFAGIPIDVRLLELLRKHWISIQDRLIEQIDKDFHVFEGRTFKLRRFAEYLIRHNIDWPLLETGALDLSDNCFKDMVRTYPQLAPLRELRVSLSQLRLSNLSVGEDGRNRCLLSPFSARTGRNQPSTTQFVFGPSVWLRGLIKPPPGHAVVYCDWRAQEFAIAAALSGDKLMLEGYESGDPYLTFARQAGAVPAEATKTSHARERELFKQCVLATQYGMGAESLAMRIGQPVAYARELLRLHRQTYRTFWKWSDGALDHAMLFSRLWTVYGWTVHIDDNPNPRSLRNFPVQANGSEMLRLACCFAVERGVKVIAPVHDALMFESPLPQLDDAIQTAQAAMAEASELVLDGFRVDTDAKVVRYPDRYMDERGERMWNTVFGIIKNLT